MTNVSRNSYGKRWSSPDEAIARIAECQHGTIGRDQLRELDLSDDEIDYRIRIGRLHPVYWRVYAVGHGKVGLDGRRMAAVLTYGDDAALSIRAAAAHWSLRPSGAIEVTVPRTRRGREGIVVHCLPLPPDEVTVHNGIPCTTVPRTIFDLGTLGRRAVERAIHEAEHQGLTDALSLHDLLERYPRRNGAPAVRAALERRAPAGTQNEFEEELFLWLERRGFPQPETGAWLELGGRWIRPDFLWRRQRVFLEADGGVHRTPYRQRLDNARDRAAQAAGWMPLRVGYWEFAEEPEQLERDLWRALGRGA